MTRVGTINIVKHNVINFVLNDLILNIDLILAFTAIPPKQLRLTNPTHNFDS